MNTLHRLLVVAISAAFFVGSAHAQSGKVTNHAFVVGKGAGVTGYTSVLCTAAQLAVGQSAADPICKTITGDVTINSSGVTALGNIPSATPMAGSLLGTVIAAPSTPAAGKDSIWVDSTDKRLHDKNDAGAIGTTVVADTGAANNFLTAISAAGAISKARPACANLSDAGVFCNGTTAASLTGTVGTASVLAASAAPHALPVDVAGTPTWKVVPDCQDATGNHLNYTQSTDVFSCGNTASGGGGSTTIISPQGRLTLTTGTPVLKANTTAQGTLYYDCYRGNQVPYYNGTSDNLDTVGSCEVSDAMVSAASAGQVVSGQVYDVWWVHGGTNRICVAMSASTGGGGGWASDTGGSNTARGTGYSQLDFTTRPYVTNKNSITNCFNAATNYGPVSANQGTYLGTIYATANGQTGMNFKPTAAAGGNNSILGVFNAYNRVPVSSISRDSTTSWTYSAATWRAADNNSNNSISWVDGLQVSMTACQYQVGAASGSNISTAHAVGCDLNSTSATPTIIGSNFATTNTVNFTDSSRDHFLPQLGFNTITAMEYGSTNGVLFGNNIATTGFQNMALQVEVSGM